MVSTLEKNAKVNGSYIDQKPVESQIPIKPPSFIKNRPFILLKALNHIYISKQLNSSPWVSHSPCTAIINHYLLLCVSLKPFEIVPLSQ